jgi:hypothetical protein
MLFPICHGACMDLMLTGEDQSQADQPNNLAEGPPSHVNLILELKCGVWIFTACSPA